MNSNRQRVINGIAAYQHEQQLLLRAMRRYGGITEKQFDRWFYHPRRAMGFMARGGVCGDSFILGGTGHTRDAMLHLLQLMILVGLVSAEFFHDGVVYRLPLDNHSGSPV